MWGLATQVSAQNNNTDLTMALKKNLDTRGLAPSLIRILAILLQTTRAFTRYRITAGQSSSATDKTLPRYLKDRTISRVRPYVLNALEVATLSSSAAKLRQFLSAPLFKFAVRLCDPFRDHHGTSMLYRGHRGWGGLPFSSISTVSRTCQCQKCTRMAVRVSTRPLHPSTGKVLGPAFSGNNILYVLGLLPPPSPSPSCPGPPFSTPFYVCQCAASDPLAKSFLHSGNLTRSYCLSLYILPAPVIRRV